LAGSTGVFKPPPRDPASPSPPRAWIGGAMAARAAIV
jgi:hypothetical protein